MLPDLWHLVTAKHVRPITNSVVRPWIFLDGVKMLLQSPLACNR